MALMFSEVGLFRECCFLIHNLTSRVSCRKKLQSVIWTFMRPPRLLKPMPLRDADLSSRWQTQPPRRVVARQPSSKQGSRTTSITY